MARLGNNGGRSYDYAFQPVKIDCNFLVDPTNTNGLGVSALVGSGVKNVFMHTTQTPGSANGYLNPNPASGYALIQLKESYFKYLGGFSTFSSPLSGSNLAINASALTVGQPYVITSVGVGTAGTVTIAPVADVSGSLASTYFYLYDGYGNKFVVWFQVSGVGSAPAVSGIPVQIAIAQNATAATIGAQLVTVIGNLLAAQPGSLGDPAGVYSFTASGTTTVTLVSTVAQPLPGGPADGAIATGFTFAVTKNQTNLQNWQAVGLPKGIVPAVGAAFIATATGYSTLGGSTGQVQLATVSGVLDFEVVGSPNMTVNPIAMGSSPNVGSWIIIQFIGATSSSVTTPIATAPAAKTTVGFTLFMESKAVTVAGE